ncbi:MAG TPA: metallophosphoesterase [Ktedonobacteraceae bacterium]
MSFFKFVISDLHIADGHPILDGFSERQQSALEGLLSAAQQPGPLGDAEDVELIINGDCFDFLAVSPYKTSGLTNSSTALKKLEKMIVAHGPFFAALKVFVALSGRHVTFIVGNHDVELAFEEVRERIRQAIGTASGINFCLSRFYRPLADVWIEHGHNYDFWNHASLIWDEKGEPLSTQPSTLPLPLGTQYFQRAAYPISIQYPYFDHFEPAMDIMRQIAMLCLLNPALVIETAVRSMKMLSYTRKPSAGMNGDGNAQQLFEEAMADFLAFQQDMVGRKPDWNEPSGQESTQAEQMTQFFSLRDALQVHEHAAKSDRPQGSEQPQGSPLQQAIAAICMPGNYSMGENVARGMHAVLINDPTLRYAIAGHTHMVQLDRVNDGAQVYLNTATWTSRFALPVLDEITPELIEWLRQPDWNEVPLRDVTQLVFVFISAESGRPSHADLCVWEGGIDGNYRILYL